MFSKVRLKRGALSHFRRLAREAYPKEIQAYLLGKIININTIEITDFVYTKNYHTQTNSEVAWFNEDFQRLKERADLEGKRIVADIHSHPNYFPVMSDQDYKSAVIEGLAVCVICSVYGKKTRVMCWTPTSSLPCVLEYI